MFTFRQRVAWIITVFYLAVTCALVYYIFEINEHFNKFAIDHVQKFHTDPGADNSNGIWHHIMDVPAVVFCIIFVLAYIQVFFMILACTRNEPKQSLAYIWPFFLYNKCKTFITNCSLYVHRSQKSRTFSDGSVTIDT